MPGKLDTRPIDRRIADVADRQFGVVALTQLHALGATRWDIDERVRQGRLFRVYRGVYSVGRRAIAREGWWLAATLTAHAHLSHRSAAALLEIGKQADLVEVTVPTTSGRPRRRGLVIHRTSSLPKDEATSHRGIPVTTTARTLLDLAEVVPRRALERALDEAQFRRRFHLERALAVTARHPGRLGAKRLTRALDEHVIGSTRTNEGLEETVFALIRAAGLPDPLVKQRIGPYEVDFLWPEARLIIEADDRASHERLSTFESDRKRDAYLDDAGYRVRRVTWRMVTREPEAVIAMIRRLLAR